MPIALVPCRRAHGRVAGRVTAVIALIALVVLLARPWLVGAQGPRGTGGSAVAPAEPAAPEVSRAAVASEDVPPLGEGSDAPPRLPFASWGVTTAGGMQVPLGVPVSAWINGIAVARTEVSTYEGQSVFALDVAEASASKPGGQDGDQISYRIGNLWADQVATWQSGNVLRVDLTGPAFATSLAQSQTWSTKSALLKRGQDTNPRVLADVNGDGLDDAVAFIANKGIKVALSQGDTFQDPTWWSNVPVFRKPSFDTFPRHLADVNGDGMDDAVVFHPSKGIKVALSTGTSFRAPTWWNRSSVFFAAHQDARPRMLADVNGDGRADAVVFHATKGVKVALSRGNSFAAPVWWSQNAQLKRASQNADPRMLADVNGDGMADALIFQQGGGTWVALSTGSRFGAPSQWSNDPALVPGSMSTSPRCMADVDGDARADVVLFDPTAGVRVALATVEGFASPSGWSSSFSWPTQEAKPRLAGDVNGDGRCDVVGFDPNSGVKVALAQ